MVEKHGCPTEAVNMFPIATFAYVGRQSKQELSSKAAKERLRQLEHKFIR